MFANTRKVMIIFQEAIRADVASHTIYLMQILEIVN
jgi:hypothetical protein